MRNQIITVLMTINGTCRRKAHRHERLSASKPPKTPPRPMPRPKTRLPKPCHSPRRRKGTRSEVTKVVMQESPPPPTPAITRPAMIVGALGAKPQMRVPIAKKTLLNIRPYLREKMSVNLPDNGWQAALAIRYPVASQESRESESKLDEMGAVRVATTVVSDYWLACTFGREFRRYQVLQRRLPTQIVPIVRASFVVLGSSASTTSSTDPRGSSGPALPAAWPFVSPFGLLSRGLRSVCRSDNLVAAAISLSLR